MTSPPRRGLHPVEVRPVRAPDGRCGWLLQLPDGVHAAAAGDARKVATLLVDVADEVEQVDD